MPIGNVLAQTWAKEEATYDAAVAPAAADAVSLEDLALEPSHEWEPVPEHVGTASLQSEVAGEQGGGWTAVCFLQPGVVGDDYDPDIGAALLKAGFGKRIAVGTTSTTYEFDDTAAISAQLSKYIAGTGGDYLWQQANGCWVDSGEIDWPGAGLPKLTLQGGFASYEELVGAPTVDGVHVNVSVIDVTTGMIDQIRTNGTLLVKFDTYDNGGEGYTVVSVDTDAEAITISPSLVTPADDLSGGEKIIPMAPSQTLASTGVLGGVSGDLTIDAVSHELLTAKTSWTTGLKPIMGEGTSNKPTGITLAEGRKVTVELTAAFRQEMAKHHGVGWRTTPALRALVQRIGVATAGKQCTITASAVRVGTSPINLPDADFAQFALATVARQSAAAGDELKLAFS